MSFTPYAQDGANRGYGFVNGLYVPQINNAPTLGFANTPFGSKQSIPQDEINILFGRRRPQNYFYPQESDAVGSGFSIMVILDVSHTMSRSTEQFFPILVRTLAGKTGNPNRYAFTIYSDMYAAYDNLIGDQTIKDTSQLVRPGLFQKPTQDYRFDTIIRGPTSPQESAIPSYYYTTSPDLVDLAVSRFIYPSGSGEISDSYFAAIISAVIYATGNAALDNSWGVVPADPNSAITLVVITDAPPLGLQQVDEDDIYDLLGPEFGQGLSETSLLSGEVSAAQVDVINTYRSYTDNGVPRVHVINDAYNFLKGLTTNTQNKTRFRLLVLDAGNNENTSLFTGLVPFPSQVLSITLSSLTNPDTNQLIADKIIELATLKDGDSPFVPVVPPSLNLSNTA